MTVTKMALLFIQNDLKKLYPNIKKCDNLWSGPTIYLSAEYKVYLQVHTCTQKKNHDRHCTVQEISEVKKKNAVGIQTSYKTTTVAVFTKHNVFGPFTMARCQQLSFTHS